MTFSKKGPREEMTVGGTLVLALRFRDKGDGPGQVVRWNLAGVEETLPLPPWPVGVTGHFAKGIPESGRHWSCFPCVHQARVDNRGFRDVFGDSQR